MVNQKGRIKDKLLMPVSIMSTAVLIIVSGVFWLTQVYSLGHANAKDIVEIKQNLKEYHKDVLVELKDINKRLSLMEGKLK